MFDDDGPSFGALFERHKRELLTYFTRRAGRDNAPDLLQETFARAMRGRLEAVADPPAFLQRIAANLTSDFRRRSRTEQRYLEYGEPPLDVPDGDAPLDERLEEEQKRRLVLATLETLPPQCRRVFALVMQQGASTKEVARELGITETMVRRHLALAVLRCRNAVPD
jgi:RNA polymerase sigma factor (sigma-70 family)